MIPPNPHRRKQLARTLTKKFQRSLESCHSYLDYLILEEHLSSHENYLRRKRAGLIDAAQEELFTNMPK